MLQSSPSNPRILCLHGGGTNALIFKYQARALIRHLHPRFRLVFANAPFISEAGPNVLPMYKDYQPFRSWLPLAKTQLESLEKESVINEIENCIIQAMEEDDRNGGLGPWVGLIGFSQGAKLCASLLFEQQLRGGHSYQPSTCYPGWKFAVLFSATAPLVSLSAQSEEDDLQKANEILGLFSKEYKFRATRRETSLTLPTIHVHGIHDFSLPLSKKLLELYCAEGSVQIIEWEGGHQIPVKTDDVQRILDSITNITGNMS